MTSLEHDLSASPIVHVRFTSGERAVSMQLEPPAGAAPLTCDRTIFDTLPYLPAEVTPEGVATLAEHYKEVLRQFVPAGGSGLDKGYERLLRMFPQRQPFELRFTARQLSSSAAIENPALRPWELILYGDAGLMERTAIVRSLDRTVEYAPTRLTDPLRTLLLQGGQDPALPELAFDDERESLMRAWHALGAPLKARIAEPVMESVTIAQLAGRIRQAKPHLLWFSGHGRMDAADGCMFLFSDSDGYVPASRIADAVREACTAAPPVAPPIIAAFWACEGLKPRQDSKASIASAGLRPSLPQFPDLVAAMADAGVEAVLGCQTLIWDWSARVMGEGLFRALAEGLGPARAVAAARAALARRPDPHAIGSDVEWTSPILWIGGARIPVLQWARPPREDEAILLRKLCDESVLAQEGAATADGDPAAPDPAVPDPAAAAPPSPAAAWIAQAPIWVEHPQLERDRLGVLMLLRRAAAASGRGLLIIRVAEDRGDFLRALATTLADVRSRLFPGVELRETDWLMSIFSLAESESRRADAWRRLIARDDLIVVIVAEGGLDYADALEEAARLRFPLIVFSPEPIEQTLPDGDAVASWAADVFGDAGRHEDDSAAALAAITTLGLTTRLLLNALTVLDLPLTKAALDRLGEELGVAKAFQTLQALHVLSAHGARYVLRAALAHGLDRDLTSEQRHAAHAACLHFLKLAPAAWFESAPVEQLRWRLRHAQALNREDEIVGLSADIIARQLQAGRPDRVVRQYQSLKKWRRRLPAERLIDVAHAYTSQGNPASGLDALTYVMRDTLNAAERVRYDLQRAEALRNLNDRTKRVEAVALLENTLAEAEEHARSASAAASPAAGASVDRELDLLILVVRHDLARNGLFFGHRPAHERAAEAKRVFEDVIERCGDSDDPGRVRLKVAALRNIADVSNRYAYGLETNPQFAIDALKEAIQLAEDHPAARSMLPEITYALAKARFQAQSSTLARTTLEQAIDIARRAGDALVLAIASNHRFWIDHRAGAGVGTGIAPDPLTPSAWEEWRRLEAALDTLADRHSWAARALVTSRLRAAKRAGHDRANAIAVLTAARDLLRHRDGMKSESDVTDRWLPVYAGLTLLCEPIWSGLGSDLGVEGFATDHTPESVWNREH